MNRFWNDIICPLFNELKPKHIIEIGVDNGLNTKNILNYCLKNDSYLVSIDPNPNFNVSEFLETFGDRFKFFEDISLNILQSLKEYDAILIDGDHNWYTVYNELKLIEENSNQESFPLIILHDVSWPYGRRDLYYNPINIPDEYRHEFYQKGIIPDQVELDENYGINKDLNNAIFENTPKNGVLTAVEDFLDGTDLKLSFYKINGFNGLGVIFSENKPVGEILDNIIRDSGIVEKMEKQYYKRIISNEKTINFFKSQLSNEDLKIQSEESSINLLKEINSNLTSERDSLVERCSNLSEKNDSLISKNNSLIDYNDILLNKLYSVSKSKKDLISERDSLVERNYLLSNKNLDLISERDSLVERNYVLSNKNLDLISENESLIELNDSLVSERDSLVERNSNLSNANLMLINEKDSLNSNLTDKIKSINNLNKSLVSERDSLVERNYNLSKLNMGLVSDKESLLILKKDLISQNKKLLKLNDELVSERDSINIINNNLIMEKDSLINRNSVLTKSKKDLLIQYNELSENYQKILHSNSWKLTQPLRKIMNLINKVF